jgi:deoxyribodipyrimidine photolyase
MQTHAPFTFGQKSPQTKSMRKSFAADNAFETAPSASMA